MAVRKAILNHMVEIAHLLYAHHYNLFAGYSSVQQYIEKSRMGENATWGSDIEIITLSHLLNTCIFTYSTPGLVLMLLTELLMTSHKEQCI